MSAGLVRIRDLFQKLHLKQIHTLLQINIY